VAICNTFGAGRSPGSTERFKPFPFEDLLKRDKINLDISWLKDESLEDSANLPDPDVIAAEIAEDLEAALDQFSQIAADLKNRRIVRAGRQKKDLIGKRDFAKIMQLRLYGAFSRSSVPWRSALLGGICTDSWSSLWRSLLSVVSTWLLLNESWEALV
jgi:hypothetical protein